MRATPTSSANGSTVSPATERAWTEAPEAVEQRAERRLSSWCSLAIRQLSSRTLTVSTCCWNVVTFPSAKVRTWAIFTLACAPEVLCFQV